MTNPFKSDRAAKMAYTRAIKVWKAKRSEGMTARYTYREEFRLHGSMDSAAYEALLATEQRCEKEAADLFEAARAVYTQATSQGYFLDTWHFGDNAKRDLIAANMD